MLMGLIRTMRPTQWTKNVLFILPPIIFDGKLFVASTFFRIVAAIALFSIVAGTVYIINDIVDIENDRQHPRKKNRPLPSGQLSMRAATWSAIVLPISAIIVALLIDWGLAVILLVYLILQIAYSFSLKHIVLIDVLSVTAAYVLRVVAGAIVVQVENFSPWLYVCSGLLALFLVIGKRRQELVTLGENAVKTRQIFREYNLPLLDDMLRMVTTGTLVAYILYTIENPIRRIFDINLALFTVPFVLYGLFRYLYIIHVRGEGGAPDEVFLSDRWLQIAILCWGLLFIILLYLVPAEL